jgi:hypothetical protein
MYVQPIDTPLCVERSSVVDNLRTSKRYILLAAGLSFLLSVLLWFLGDKEQGLFVGLWVPSILSLGAFIYAGRGG